MPKDQRCYFDNSQQHSGECETRLITNARPPISSPCAGRARHSVRAVRSPFVRSHARKRLASFVAVTIGCFLAAFFFVACDKAASPAAATPKPTQKIDLNALRAKAEGGEAQAQKELGTLYSKGEGIKQSYRDAAEWYQKAAEGGH